MTTHLPLTIGIALLSLSAPLSASMAPAPAWNSTYHPSLGFRFDAPPAWVILKKENALLLQRADNPTKPAESRLGVISVTRGATPNRNPDMTLEQLHTWFMAHATLANENMALGDWYIPSFHLEEQADVTLLGHPATQYVFTGEIRSKKYRIWKVQTIFDGSLWIAQLISPIATYDNDAPTFRQLLASVKWNDNGTSRANAPATERKIQEPATGKMTRTERVRMRREQRLLKRTEELLQHAAERAARRKAGTAR